jgi:hypothetical protein
MLLKGRGRDDRLWDVKSRKPLGAPLARHTLNVESVAFNADGRTLASGSWDRTIRLWDVQTHKPLGVLITQRGVYGVAWSPDGRTLAAASIDTRGRADVHYLDAHGQSEIGFTITRLLDFDLLPRMKQINKAKLYGPDRGQPDAYPAAALRASEMNRARRGEVGRSARGSGARDGRAVLARRPQPPVQLHRAAALAGLWKPPGLPRDRSSHA